MIINLTELPTTKAYEINLKKLEEQYSKSKWIAIANGDFGQSRVDEGKRMLAIEEQQIKQVKDIINHMDAEPHTVINVSNCYEQREMLKANGYRWNPNDRVWYKKVLSSSLDAELKKIK